METWSKVEIVGRLESLPPLRYTRSGRPVLSIMVSVGDFSRTWIEVEISGRQAEITAEKARRGNTIHLKGRLGVIEWTDRRSGRLIDRRKQIVIADEVSWIERTAPAPQPDPRAGRDE